MAQLPSDLHEQLQRAISDVFERAWDALRPESSTPTAVEDIVLSSAREAVLTAARQKYATIAQAARLKNEQSSWLKRLPNELWCHIWERLPFVDRFTTTHVCAHWWEAMPTLPHLWTDLHFYAYDVKPGRTPAVHTVPDILALSRDLPLDVTVETHVERPAWNVFIGIAQALKPHAARIARLCIRSGHVDGPNFLLRHFSVLPALRELSAERLPARREGRYLTFDFWAPQTELPALERVALDSGFAFDRTPSERRLPSVGVAALTPRENANVEVCAALACCTQLDALRLHMCAADSAFGDWPGVELCGLATRLPSVTITALRTSNETWVMRAFSHASRRELVLEYQRCDATPLQGWYILSDLLTHAPADAVDVIVGYDIKRRLSVRGTASDGRIRSIALVACENPSVHLNRVGETLGYAKCSLKVTLDASLRDHFPTIRSVAPHAELTIEATRFSTS